MIHDLDESLRALVRRDVVQGGDVDVVFDAPTKEWAARRNTPTIDIYLYDIREDLHRRHYGVVDLKDDAGHTYARRQPPRFFKLSYLVTAWTQRPEDEHRLLAGLLACFLRSDCVPPDVLAGSLADEEVPYPIHIAIPPPEDRALSDVWSALGGELKPSLDLVVVAPIDLDRAKTTAAPVREDPQFEFRRPNGASEGAPKRPLPASSQGRPSAPALAEDTVAVSKEPQQGRIFRVRNTPDPRDFDE
jgi:hypothetical protein